MCCCLICKFFFQQADRLPICFSYLLVTRLSHLLPMTAFQFSFSSPAIFLSSSIVAKMMSLVISNGIMDPNIVVTHSSVVFVAIHHGKLQCILFQCISMHPFCLSSGFLLAIVTTGATSWSTVGDSPYHTYGLFETCEVMVSYIQLLYYSSMSTTH